MRVQIEQLACCEPAGVGLELTPWAPRTLAAVAVARGMVPKIAPSTVSLSLRAAELQPHRWRYWKTPPLNTAFVERASKILWCDAHVDRLEEQGEGIICFDEKPHVQALERCQLIQWIQPGRVERQEFEYRRHGTVNFAVALRVQDGRMWGWCLDKNDSAHVCTGLEALFTDLKGVEKIHLLWDGGSSPIAQATRKFLQTYRGWVRGLVTPPPASWLNQAELLLRAFSPRYLHRGNWQSREHLIHHLAAATKEYNTLFAHPFTRAWTRRDMRRWVERHRNGLP